MNEAVDRVIEQREAMDRGFPAGFVMSGLVHLLVIGGAFGVSWLGANEPPLRAVNAFAVPLPPGGGGSGGGEPARAAAPPVTAPPTTEPPAPAPEPPPKVLKPPKETPKGLPKLDARKLKIKEEPRPVPRRGEPEPPDFPRRASTGSGGAGTNSDTPGIGILGPAGPGAPGGTDPNGDWYLAGVQRKIWLIWTRQMKTGFSQSITVSFTILGDGSLEEGSVRILQPSGVYLLDNAAQRAVLIAAPFGPLPRTYGTNRITIQALFQPTS